MRYNITFSLVGKRKNILHISYVRVVRPFSRAGRLPWNRGSRILTKLGGKTFLHKEYNKKSFLFNPVVIFTQEILFMRVSGRFAPISKSFPSNSKSVSPPTQSRFARISKSVSPPFQSCFPSNSKSFRPQLSYLGWGNKPIFRLWLSRFSLMYRGKYIGKLPCILKDLLYCSKTSSRILFLLNNNGYQTSSIIN